MRGMAGRAEACSPFCPVGPAALLLCPNGRAGSEGLTQKNDKSQFVDLQT